MSRDGQGTKCRRNIAENYNHLSRVHERYRRQTDRQKDGRQHIARSLKTTRLNFTKFSVHVTYNSGPVSSDDSAIRYVLPVL